MPLCLLLNLPAHIVGNNTAEPKVSGTFFSRAILIPTRVLEKKGKEHPTHTHTHTQARGNLKKKKHEKAFDARRQ